MIGVLRTARSITALLLIVSVPFTLPAQKAPSEGTSTAGPGEAFRAFGKNILLEVDPKGEILWSYDQQTGAFQSLTAKVNVHFKSESFDLRCDKLVYTGKEEKMVATGNPVYVRQSAINATCGRLEYFVKDKRSELSENPKILNEDEKGEWTSTLTGNRIILVQDEQGNTSILGKGEGKKKVSLTLNPTEKPAEEEKKPKATGPEEIGPQNLDKIREVEVSK